MSGTLAGHLEDVDLDEVVKVIGLSRRSGVLSVTAPHATAEILFHYGRAVRVQLSTSTDTVGQVLQTAGVLGAHDLATAGSQTVDDVLRRAQERRPDESGLINRAEAVLREKLEATLLEILALGSGSFELKTSDSAETPTRYPRDTSFIVPDGIEVETAAREARRRRQQRDNNPLGNLSRPPTSLRSDEGEPVPELLIVDDDPHFLGALEVEGAGAGLSVSALSGARSGLDALSRMNGEAPSRMMVVDLVMPRANGRGILGGLEVLRAAAEQDLADRLFLAFEDEHTDARRIAEELGAGAVLVKPRPGEGFASFLNPVLERMGRPPLVDAPVDLVGELRVELGESARDWAAEPDLRLDESSRALEVLKSLLGQVNNPAYEDEIPLLLLRFAAAFFTRGALFGAHHESGHLVGLGGYGVGSADPGRAIHAIKIPMSADTVFTRPIREKCGVRQPFYESEWNLRLMDALGGPRPREVYTAPLLSPRGLEAVLYADNAIDGRPFPDVALLEIFVQQVGVAIERSSLVRQIEQMMAGGAPTRLPGAAPGPAT